MSYYLIIQEGDPFYKKKAYKFKTWGEAHARGLHRKIIDGCDWFRVTKKLTKEEKKLLVD